MAYLDILMRILHIGSACILAGGLAFILLGMLPAMRVLDEQYRETLTQLARRGFVRLTHAAIGLLLISGIYNWWRNIPTYRLLKDLEGPGYMILQGLLGLKVLLAVAVFVIIFAEGAGVLRGPAKRWLTVNLILTTIIIIFGAIVRYYRLSAG